MTTLRRWLIEDAEVPQPVADALLRHLGVGFAGAELPVALTDADRRLAWTLAFELESRITTQALGFRVGDEATAAGSVASLFGTVRARVTQAGPDAGAVAELALWMLNAHVRSYTARWHGLAEKGVLSQGDHARRFRSELEELQAWLRLWCAVFRRIGDPDPAAIWGGGEDVPAAPGDARTTWNAEPDVGSRLKAAERELLQTGFATGLAVSGGGIRSATFALGVLSGLAGSRDGSSAVPLLDGVDYVSTVSGGGYLGTLIATQRAAEHDPLASVEHVRQHSSAMAEGLLASMLVPWLVGLTTTLAPAVAGLVAGAWLLQAFDGVPVLGAAVPGALLLVGVLATTTARTLGGSTRLGITAFAVGAVGLGLALANDAVNALADALPVLQGLLAPGLVAGLLGGAGVLVRRTGVTWLLAPLLGAAFVVAAVGMQPVLVGTLGPIGSAALFALAVAWAALPDANGLTLRHHYEARLVQTWVPRPDLADDRLDGFQGKGRRPIQLWNLALNVPGVDEADRRALHGRAGQPLTVSALGAECALDGFLGTDGSVVWGPSHRAPLTVRQAMSISGAAVSPMMGNRTEGGTRAWLTLLNGRMGAWIPNPRRDAGDRSPYVPGVYVLQELFGRAGVHGAFVHVSDGGHVENLGVLPLLRRRCRFVVAIDGEADPGHTFNGLWRLQLRARLDLDATLDLDTADLELDAHGRADAHAIAIPITYADGSTGLMLYVKLSVTGDEPQYVAGHRSQHPDFPHETTADQFFDEAQFEAYRALGEHIGVSLTSAPWLREVPGDPVGWIEALGARMLDKGGAPPWSSQSPPS